MSFYLLVEGKRTETIVYPKWFEILIPNFKRVDYFDKIQKNSYYLFSAGGYPSILDDIENALEDIQSSKTGVDYLVVSLDVDDETVDSREEEIQKIATDFFKRKDREPNVKIKVICQNRCFETWFLGNRKVMTRTPSEGFSKIKKGYDVSLEDPELLEKTDGFEFSNSQYHAFYLVQMLKEKNINYTKKNPSAVCQETYLNEIIKRTTETSHLKSFKEFLKFCDELNSKSC